MLICISDCVYFDIGLRQSIIQKKNCCNKITKIVSYTSKIKVSDFPIYFHSTKNIGSHLNYILVDYSQNKFQTLQSVLFLKTFYPLTKVFICIKGDFVFTEHEKSLIFIINAEVVYNFSDFCDLIRISDKRNTCSPCDILFNSIPSNLNISRKEVLYISLVISGLSSKQISAVLNLDIKRVYYYRNKIFSKLIIKNNIELICRVQILTIRFYNKVLRDEIVSLR